MFIDKAHNLTSLFFFAAFSFLVIFALLLLTLIFSTKNWNYTKLTPYECGFSPFNQAKQFFDIQFYKTAILFLIFDLEVALLVPLVVNLGSFGSLEYFIVLVFIFILMVGFLYEWCEGSLDWV